MTLQECADILNRENFWQSRGMVKWSVHPSGGTESASGLKGHDRNDVVSYFLPEFEAVAIAREFERRRLERRTVTILYTNHRGQTAYRRIVPRAIRFAASEWHPEEQWLLDALDLDRGAERSFAVKDIQAWRW